jgi:hypothetical protein
MNEKRLEPRMLCADLVEVRWRDTSGELKSCYANLEDISPSGACLQMDLPVPNEAPVTIGLPEKELEGRARYCVFHEIGYFIGVQFDPGVMWHQQEFEPMHLLDPRELVERALQRVCKDKSPPDGSGFPPEQ